LTVAAPAVIGEHHDPVLSIIAWPACGTCIAGTATRLEVVAEFVCPARAAQSGL
jgi:hypothetical protein